MCGDRGFSTVEIIVVVMLLAIFAAVGIPALLPSIQRYRTKSATDQVTGDLRRVQGLALTTGTPHRFLLRDCPSGPTPCKQYRIERQIAGPSWPPFSNTMDNDQNILTEWIDLQTDYSGVRITQLTDNGGMTVTNVIFDSRGASINSVLTYPLLLTVASTAGPQRTLQIRSAGGIQEL